MLIEAQTPPPGEDQDELDAVMIQDNGEPLVDFLGMSPRLVVAPIRSYFNFPRVHVVRKSVAEKLVQAAESLPAGFTLSVVEGYRPIQVQRVMYGYALERAKQMYPDWDERALGLEAGRWSAPPDAITPPPHITGGAVDLDIIDSNGVSLNFSAPYERGDPRGSIAMATGLTEEADTNRALLRSILEPTGLTNYVDEWWHWSYGDNGWALRVGAPGAIYGRVELPEDVEWIGDPSELPE